MSNTLDAGSVIRIVRPETMFAELPADLLKELSHNLFAKRIGEPVEAPQAVHDALMQGLTSLRVKTGDSEVEAKREK